MTDSISLTAPDDWHCHFRDGEAMASVVEATARQFARAIAMPNLRPPVVNVEQARAYRERLRAALPAGSGFEPLMTLYLTEATDPAQIVRGRESGVVTAVKYYPAGATTNSAAGVRDIQRCEGVLEAMQAQDMPLLVHGEVTDPEVDVFDREAVFIERILDPLVRRFPKLRVVMEHITTTEAARYVQAAPARVAATITAHHLLLNRNAIFAGGLRPHHYCLPVLKREPHRQALIAAATSGAAKFFAGTDSAPHPRGMKEHDCGAAGIYTAHAAVELYAEVFEDAGALDRLEAFMSHHGADFYGLPRNRQRITLERQAWEVPAEYPFGAQSVVPLRAGGRMRWRFSG